ncbi:hypothetical protein [Prosthecobacter sp.]|uniref:hypothetical protein n=1 Tax=Prosthecobacter sp. TaxID=1965333 RepID=UPI003784D2A6
MSSQHPLQQPGAPKELSGQVPAPDKKPLVTQQDLATARHLEEMRQRSEKARQAGYQDPGSMTWNERNRYNSTLPKQTQERGDGQMNNHMAVGGEYSKLFGMDERGELGAGIIFKTNPHMPFEPFDEKDARDAFIKRSWGKMEK